MSTLCVAGWQKTTTGMAKLRADWSKSSIKKLVARLLAAGGETGAVYSRKRYFTAVSGAQVDELRAEFATSPRVSVAVVAKKTWDLLIHSVASAAPQPGEKKANKGIRAQRISPATRLRRLKLRKVSGRFYQFFFLVKSGDENVKGLGLDK